MSAAKHAGCTVDGCDGEHRALGLCRKHYAQKHRSGAPITRPGFPSKPKASPGPRTADPFVPENGTLTLEQWKRVRSQPAADIHIVPTKAVGE